MYIKIEQKRFKLKKNKKINLIATVPDTISVLIFLRKLTFINVK